MGILNIDPNTAYPIGIVLLAVVFMGAQALSMIITIKYFATSSDLANLRTDIAEHYCRRDEFEKKLDDFKRDMKAELTDIKGCIVRVFDKLDAAIGRGGSNNG